MAKRKKETPAAPAPWEPNQRTTLLAGGVILLAALLIRLAAAWGDLWQDEIWSLFLIKIIQSPVEILTKLHHDNNHPLNSLYLMAVGDSGALAVRGLSIATGLLTVALMWPALIRRGRLAALGGVLLAACSFPLILYSSEARGYAPAACFALAGYLLLRAFHDRRDRGPNPLVSGPGWLMAAAYWLLAMAAFLAQASFIYVFLAFLAYSAMRAHHGDGPTLKSAGVFLQAQAPPLIFTLAYYLGFISQLRYGGGPSYGLSRAATGAYSLMMGGPESGPLAVAFAILAVAALLGGALAAREKPWDSVLLLGAAALLPAAVVLALDPTFLYFRYFLVCAPFFLMALVLAADQLRKSGSKGVIAAGLLVAIFLAGNLYTTFTFLDHGRGGYSQAVAYMADHTDGPDIVVGSDYDFDNKMLLDYYAPRLIGDKQLLYVPGKKLPASPPEWFLLEKLDPDELPPPSINIPGGAVYDLEKSFPYSGFSGFSWHLYHRVGGN